MNATEIAIYAVETKAIIHILWGLLLIASISLVGLAIMHGMLRLRLRAGRKREAQLARRVAAKSEDLARLEPVAAEAAAAAGAAEGRIADVETELKRVEAIRAKTESRLVKQNAEVDKLRARLAAQGAELAHLRTLIEHVGDV